MRGHAFAFKWIIIPTFQMMLLLLLRRRNHTTSPNLSNATCPRSMSPQPQKRLSSVNSLQSLPPHHLLPLRLPLRLIPKRPPTHPILPTPLDRPKDQTPQAPTRQEPTPHHAERETDRIGGLIGGIAVDEGSAVEDTGEEGGGVVVW